MATYADDGRLLREMADIEGPLLLNLRTFLDRVIAPSRSILPADIVELIDPSRCFEGIVAAHLAVADAFLELASLNSRLGRNPLIGCAAVYREHFLRVLPHYAKAITVLRLSMRASLLRDIGTGHPAFAALLSRDPGAWDARILSSYGGRMARYALLLDDAKRRLNRCGEPECVAEAKEIEGAKELVSRVNSTVCDELARRRWVGFPKEVFRDGVGGCVRTMVHSASWQLNGTRTRTAFLFSDALFVTECNTDGSLEDMDVVSWIRLDSWIPTRVTVDRRPKSFSLTVRPPATGSGYSAYSVGRMCPGGQCQVVFMEDRQDGMVKFQRSLATITDKVDAARNSLVAFLCACRERLGKDSPASVLCPFLFQVIGELCFPPESPWMDPVLTPSLRCWCC